MNDKEDCNTIDISDLKITEYLTNPLICIRTKSKTRIVEVTYSCWYLSHREGVAMLPLSKSAMLVELDVLTKLPTLLYHESKSTTMQSVHYLVWVENI